jgi:hypothetical protein
MRYISTRGQAPLRDFAGVLLAGLAEDGGLYVPESWPRFAPADWRAMRGLAYPALAARVMQPFVGDALPSGTLTELCRAAYAGFGHPAVVPLIQLETNLFVQELFHGPTLAFKDLALQLVGPLFDHVLAARDARVTIVGATSGDTGSAAIEACAGRERIDIVILHPHNRTSEVQRRQMTTVQAPNVGNIAIEGTFDDCQDLVKAMFADAPFRQEMQLSAVNSFNWARIAAQIPYYVAAALSRWIDDGYDIVALVPSCALMFKFEWPLILPNDAAVRKLASATFDVSEYLVDIARKEGLAPGMTPLEGGVTVHLACHARAQNMGQKAAEMLRLLPARFVDRALPLRRVGQQPSWKSISRSPSSRSTYSWCWRSGWRSASCPACSA